MISAANGWNLTPSRHSLRINSDASCGNLYEAYVRQYAELDCNYTFTITQSSFLQSGVTVELQVDSDEYAPLIDKIQHVATIKKLILLTRLIHLLQYMKEHLEGVLIHSIDNVFVNRSNHLRFIPVPPSQFKSPVTEHDTLKSIGFSLFNLAVPTSSETVGFDQPDIPHEVANYLLCRLNSSHQKISDEQMRQLDDFVFFQAWIYCDAVRVALADDELSLVEVKNLRKISRRLALRDAQAEQLENIAMLKQQSFENFLRSQQAE
ncbi:hypothetical protein QTP81_07585 [Alteromonas sp. ASW11-36]|uniref:Uncharacterized protein n=1 Tax=Alteromonas arenosi TaxID=3055817 RepID=A0ABT7SWB0_9ALTE|nr:hypothetical protein [Alteromonas sp. ASW11-36]MDM7860454.1 hypothetical protein [Alteromonas sp. ASW11-36]